jgi:hypothetical protein
MKQTNKYIITSILIILMVVSMFFMGCTAGEPTQAGSDAGVQKAVAVVQTDAAGHTVEQNNIIKKYAMDNDPATIRFVYIISPYDHKVISKFTAVGKVTSSGKRLTPTEVGSPSGGYRNWAMPVVIAGEQRYTGEVIQDDGTYGTSAEYLYAFLTDGSMIQIYTGGAIVEISTKPLTIQDGVISLQYVDEKGNPIK